MFPLRFQSRCGCVSGSLSLGRCKFVNAIRSGLSDQEAEDVVQETVISIAKKMPEFVYDPAKCSFKGWLMHVTRLRILDQLRRRQPPSRAQSATTIPGELPRWSGCRMPRRPIMRLGMKALRDWCCLITSSAATLVHGMQTRTVRRIFISILAVTLVLGLAPVYELFQACFGVSC